MCACACVCARACFVDEFKTVDGLVGGRLFMFLRSCVDVNVHCARVCVRARMQNAQERISCDPEKQIVDDAGLVSLPTIPPSGRQCVILRAARYGT